MGSVTARGFDSGDPAVGAWLLDVAPRWFGTSGDSWAVLGAIRKREPKLAPTWLAATALRGDTCSPAAEAEVAATRARQQFYADLADRLATRFPGLRAIKGPVVARRYPRTLVRHLGDLDAVLPNEEQVYELGSVLLAQGWSRYGLIMWQLAGRRHVLLTLVRPAEHSDQPIYGVQVGTAEVSGNLLGVTTVRRLPAECAETRSLLSVIAERTERPYELRDLLDAFVLVRGLPAAELTELQRLIRMTALAPEARELRALLGRFAPGADLPLPAVTAARLRRMARAAAAGSAIHGRLAQHAVLHQRWRGLAGPLLVRLAERTTARRALGAGWQLSGQPLGEKGQRAIRALLPHDVKSTPIGDWLMTISPEPPPRIARALRAAGEDVSSC